MKQPYPLNKSSLGNIALAGLFACLFSWVIEAVIHSYVLRTGSLDSHLFSLSSHHVSIWLINSIFFIGFGMYAQSKFDKCIREQNELKSSCDELGGRLDAQSRILAAETQYRQKAESALRQEEVKFRDLFDNINDGILIADSATKNFVEVNKTMCSMLGHTREEVLDLGIKDIHRPQDLPVVVAAFERLIHSNQKIVTDLPVMRKDRTVFYADVGQTTVFMNGRPCGVGIFRDVTERRLQEEELEIRRRQLELIIDSTPIIIFYKDRDSKFVRVNTAFAEALDKCKEDFTGKTVFDFFPPRIARDMSNDDHQVLQSGRPKLNITRKCEFPKGTRWLQTDKIPLYDAQGAPCGLIGFAQDITERKLAEEAVRESEERFRSLFDLAMDGIVLINDTNSDNPVIMDANAAACAMHGYSRTELIGKPLSILEETPHRDIDTELVNGVLAGRPRMFERTRRRRDGSRFPVEIHACAVAIRDKRCILTIERDISDRKKAEEALHRAKEEWERTFDAAADPIMIVGTDYRIHRANRAMAEMMGVTAGDLAGKICYEQVIHKTDVPPDCPHARLLKDGKCHSDEIFVPHLEKFLSVSVSPLFDAEGGLTGSVHFSYDITQRKNLEMTLSKYRKHLEFAVGQRTAELRTEIAERRRADKELRCYTAQLQELSARLVEAGEEERRTIARELHDEIGQLLTGLKMSIETVVRSPVNKQDDILGRMQVIVGELLRKVRAMSLNLHPAVLDDLGLERALEHLSRQYRESSGLSAALTCDLPHERLPRQIELAAYRVVQEALTNVIRYAGVAEAEVIIRKSNDVITVSIVDKGKGFDAQAALGKRTSIGLVGMRERMAAVDGRLTVTSKPGEGTIIAAEIPLPGQKGARRHASVDNYIG